MDNDRPIVLISAGIGITPMVSMLHVLAIQNRRIYFVHGARNGPHHPFREEVAALAGSNDMIQLIVLYTNPHEEDVEDRDYHRSGRIDMGVMEKFVPINSAEFFVCGSKRFLADMVSLLTERGVADKYIHIESFN